MIEENQNTTPDQDFDVNVPDIPLPTVQEDKSVKDTFDSAMRFCFLGAGQGGSRLAATFYRIGYRRVVCINTAEQDLANIQLPENLKLSIGGGGAGKNPDHAKRIFSEKSEDVLDFARRQFGSSFDRIFVTVGCGGGTGAGTAIGLVKMASELQETLKCKSNKVGVIAALPQNSEGRKVCANAYHTLNNLCALVEEGLVSPLIILDNEKINTIFPNLAVDSFWDRANLSVASLFHLFNTIATKPSRYTSFDAADYGTIIDSGITVFGATPVTKWTDPADISYAVRDNLKKNILSGGLDLSTGNVAGAIVIGSKTILETLPQDYLNEAFGQLTRILRPNSTVHRGIYRGDKENLVVYTMIGGIGKPTEKLQELAKLGDIQIPNKHGILPEA